MSDRCPDCGHPWRAHQGRNGGECCWYNNLTRAGCPCRRKNPDIEAEDRLAAAAWRMWMGYPERGQGDDPLSDPEPIANETESGYARRRELVAEARASRFRGPLSG